MDLPLDLQTALDKALAHVPPSDLSTATRELSGRYRCVPGQSTYLRTEIDVLAYAAYRLPATYAAVNASMRAARETLPNWHPVTLLDVGAGPGTAAWAAVVVWPTLSEVELVEKDDRMIALGRTLMNDHGALAGAGWTQSDVLQWTPQSARDLVVMSYALGELGEAQRVSVLQRLWIGTLGVLVLVEPGTPAGFEVIRAARTYLTQLGADVIAPCPHSVACPMEGADWCHFSQRLARSRIHRDAKRVAIGYEDEKYSYVAVARIPATPTSARVLRHPQIRAGHIRLELCTDAGLEHRIVSKREKQRFREVRQATWGSALEPDERPADPARGRPE